MESAQEAQKSAMEMDERQGMVEQYLSMLLPERWEKMDLYERRSYISEKDSPTVEKGVKERKVVCNAEIWCECFGRSLSDMKPADSYAIAALMTQVHGWTRTKESMRFDIYGKQRIYKKTTEQEK